jgi:hypothetical protein
MQNRFNIIVQEDNTLSHAYKHQDLVFMNVDVLRLLWSSNSLDLNMIESCWFWMKRIITRKDASRNRVSVIKTWTECWIKQLKQKRIQHWIERISRHIQQIIELDEDNVYRENKEDDEIRLYDSNDRQIKYLRIKQRFNDNESSEKSISDNVFDVNDDEINENWWDELFDEII